MKPKQPSITLPPIQADTKSLLFALGERFVKLAPWKTLGNADLFCIEEKGRSGWVVVLGHGGEVFGLAIYQGLQGLQQFKHICSGQQSSPWQRLCFFAELNLLNFNWLPDIELDPVDREFMKGVAKPSVGQGKALQFQSYAPGYVPWAMGEEEALFMLRGLQAAELVKDRVEQGFNPFGTRLTPLVRFNGQFVEFGFVEPEEWRPPELPEAALGSEAMARVKDVKRQGIWQAGHFYVPSHIMHQGRPHHMHVVALAEAESGYVYPPQTVAPGDSLAQALAQALLGAQALPQEIEFSDKLLMKASAAALASLGIRASYKTALPALDRVQEGLFTHFKAQSMGGGSC